MCSWITPEFWTDKADHNFDGVTPHRDTVYTVSHRDRARRQIFSDLVSAVENLSIANLPQVFAVQLYFVTPWTDLKKSEKYKEHEK